MSRELYIRKVVLEVIPAVGNGRRIQDLRIKFSCEKQNEGTPNKAEIEIYNLSGATRSIMEAKNTKVRLYVGYLGLTKNAFINAGINLNSSVELIFVGNVNKVTHDIQTPDIITKLEVKDGENAYRNAKIEKGYPPNSTLKNIFKDLNDSMNIPAGSQEVIPDFKYANGLTLSGLTRDHLDVLCRANGLEWSIQDETLQIIKRKKGTTDFAVVLSAETGLVGTPNKTDKGVEFESLLQPLLRPGRKVKLESKILSGTYIVRKVKHEGDSQEGKFTSSCETTK